MLEYYLVLEHAIFVRMLKHYPKALREAISQIYFDCINIAVLSLCCL